MSKKKQIVKGRNPFVLHIIKKKCGAHSKLYKVERRNNKLELKNSFVSDRQTAFA